MDARRRTRRAATCARIAAQPPLVRLSNARSEWGSCNAKGEIRLNWRLVQLPPMLAEYVVAHEVAHLVELNHSARFWALVEALLPGHAALRRAARRLDGAARGLSDGESFASAPAPTCLRCGARASRSQLASARRLSPSPDAFSSRRRCRRGACARQRRARSRRSRAPAAPPPKVEAAGSCAATQISRLGTWRLTMTRLPSSAFDRQHAVVEAPVEIGVARLERRVERRADRCRASRQRQAMKADSSMSPC